MARILSRDRDKDPFNEDEAERRYLQSKPACFIVIGKPGCGKTTLAKKFAKTWKCEAVTAKETLLQAMELSTELGLKAQAILARGESIPEELASQLLEEKISSPEVAHHGYILDGFPSLCEDWISAKEQLELVKSWKYKPDYIINLKIPDKDIEDRLVNQRVDPVTNRLYTKDVYDPQPSVIVKDEMKTEEKEEVEQEEEDEENEELDSDEEEEENGSEDDENGFSSVVLSRLVTRPQDLAENVKSSIKRYKDLMLRLLEDYMIDHDPLKVIEVDANLPPKVVFKALMMKLNTFVINRAFTTLPLQGDEDAEEISRDADTDDLLRSLASAQLIAPRFRWRRSRWGRLCPVELYGGNIVPGHAIYSVSFLDKIFCMSSKEALTLFIRNPRPYLTDPLPCPPCKVCIIGPPSAGKTTLAKSLAQRYQAQYFDLGVLIQTRREIAKKRLLDEVREESLEGAIAKVTIRLQIQKEEEEERLAKELLDDGEKGKDLDEQEEPNDVDEHDEDNGDEGNVVEVEASEEAKEELLVDENHPEVMRLVNEALLEAEQREPDIAAEEYVDVIEEAIQSRFKEVEEARGKGHRIGSYVLDNFPFTREQFTLMIERGFVPDSFICLNDESPNGAYLFKRWASARQGVVRSLEDISEDSEVNKETKKAEDTSKLEQPTSKVMESYQALRTTFDNNCQQLMAIVKGTNNLKLTTISCENDEENTLEETIKAVEGVFKYAPWEYTGMDEDEEEEDAADDEDDEFVEGEENGIFNRDFGRKMFGDTKHYCPVMLKENGVLWPGVPECAAKYRERVYFFSNVDCRRQFLDDPTQYLPIDRALQPPPIRLFIIGPKGSGKTLHGRYLAQKLGVFHIDFRERLQELIIAKTKKRVGPDYESEDESNEEDKKELEADSKSDGDVKEMKLTEEEEFIHAYLADGEPLQRAILENIIRPWWNDEPFKSRGFVLEGFPAVEDEVRLLSSIGLFPDAAIVLAVEDSDIVKRLLPAKLAKWRVKRDQRVAEKNRLKELALQAKAEIRAKRREEFMLEIAAKEAEKQKRLDARKGSDSGGEGDEDDEDDEDEDEDVDVEALLDAELETDDDVEEEEEETEEEASDRIKIEMTDRYEEEVAKIAIVQETLEEILIARVEVDGGRRPHIVRFTLEKALKPIVDYREGLFDRCLIIDGSLAQRMLIQGYKFLSRFGKWCPVKLLDGDVTPPYVAPGTPTFPAVYRQFIYYLSSEKARNLFIACPTKYLKQPSPKPVVPVKMAVIGPPRSGKTTVAKRFATEYGVLRLSIGEVLRRLLASQPNTHLAKQIKHHLRSGCTVPDDLAVQALEIILLDMQCQVKGYILDGFPVTRHQIDLMIEKTIIPVKLLELNVSDDEVFKRATLDRRSPERFYPVHDSHSIISVRLACWKKEVGNVRDWYQNIQRNLVRIDGERSKWMVWIEVKEQAKNSVTHIQDYLARINEGQAASIANMCITPKEFLERLGDFGQYCPVSLADHGHLVNCSGTPSLEFAAEFRGRYYKMENSKALEKFLKTPDDYVPPLAPRTLPPRELLPKRRSVTQMKDNFPCQIELQGYCPVTFLDGKKRYEVIIAGKPELVVEYREKFYTFESEKKLDKFMRVPEKYHGLKLPCKLPPKAAPLSIHQLPMLGFLEQTVATAITKALTSVGCFKPKYPFLCAQRSALLYVAYHLKAFNPKSSEYVQEKYKQKLKKFEEKCKLIKYLGRNMTDQYTAPTERPFEFDKKMKNFLELKILRPTFV